MNPATCSCACLEIFSGDECEVCGLTCENGGALKSDQCACDCTNAWGGLQCEDCNTVCKNGGTLDADICFCQCDKSFIGNDCGECPVTADYCTNGATTDETNCECQCTSDLFSGPDCGETPPNVALRKPSFAGPVVIEGEPKLVNDGHLASCVKVGGGTNTYWQVDLQQDYDIYGILVANYYDACRPHPFDTGKTINEVECNKLNGAVVTISDNENPMIPGQAAPSAAFVSSSWDVLADNGKHMEDYATGPKVGRFVRVSGVTKLQISEVQVYGKEKA